MRKIKKYIKAKPHHLLSVPVLLCFVTFITNLIAALKDGVIDSNELHQLLSTADGFETVVLLIVMVVLRDKKK
ncbi:TPA: hypothetical protein ACPSKZ_000665 [Legionella anisa]|uniref:hypothetical protein n=1 Tax=Legionella anisa TaxID=28082 RepID=UPI0022430CA3|nr:hypothetical protein [Legionella anisa]MCW8425637.1 hypothetical protein [Legionella anisa]MCW8448934.1 hypothetical protein [Legionella anisa]